MGAVPRSRDDGERRESQVEYGHPRDRLVFRHPEPALDQPHRENRHGGTEVANEARARGGPRGRGGVAAFELFRCTQILRAANAAGGDGREADRVGVRPCSSNTRVIRERDIEGGMYIYIYIYREREKEREVGYDDRQRVAA